MDSKMSLSEAAKAHRDAEAEMKYDRGFFSTEIGRKQISAYKKGFDSGYEFARKELLDKEKILKIVQDWKYGWMNQRQNSEADYQNYYSRAFGVDANMVHSLARQIVDKLTQPQPEGE